MKIILTVLVFALCNLNMIAQKKVAVVSFYGDKIIDFEEIAGGSEILLTEVLNLRDNPDFNLEPIMQEFHKTFFEEYSKGFPFKLLPEEEVLSNDAYINFEPKYEMSAYNAQNYIVIEGYKYIYEGFNGRENEEGIAKIFSDQADGVLFVEIHFGFTKGFGIGGIQSLKMTANARMALYNKLGKKVFAINESANSKKTVVMVNGIPATSPEKILPLCESALEKLMKDLDKRLPKIIKKAAKKL